eukprot:6200079-Lingulodinium_polyedra.AAC.1
MMRLRIGQSRVPPSVSKVPHVGSHRGIWRGQSTLRDIPCVETQHARLRTAITSSRSDQPDNASVIAPA